MAEHEKPNKGATDDWWTPIEIVHSLGHFDLDPCGNKLHKTANTIYESNGLDLPWFGRIWMNPPYSEAAKWVNKFIEHGNGVALMFARTDTKWCQKLLQNCQYVYFIKGRISFLKGGVKQNGTGGAPSALFYINKHNNADFVEPCLEGVLK